MKKIIASILLVGLIHAVLAEESIDPSVIYTIAEIKIEGSEFADRSIQRYLPFQVGSQMTLEELDEKLRKGRIAVQYDVNYYFLDYEYQTTGDKVYITLEVIDASMPFTFNAFESGPIVGYRNIFAEGVTLNAWLGFSRQMLELDWKRITNGPIGFSLLAGHRLFNPFDSDYRSSAPGATMDIFLWLTPWISVGTTSNLYGHGSPPDGFATQKTSIASTSLGGFLEMNHMALMDIIGLGFDFKTEYLYYVTDLTDNTNRINVRARAIMRPFPTDRFAVSLSGDVTWASGDLMNRGSVSLSPLSGRSAWQSGLFFPTNIVKISSGVNYYIGLEPGLWVGRAGEDSLEFNNPDIGVSLAPTFQVGFPASVFFASRFLYNIDEGQLLYSFAFTNLPYTQELDLGW